jgi:hypothetical protein
MAVSGNMEAAARDSLLAGSIHASLGNERRAADVSSAWERVLAGRETSLARAPHPGTAASGSGEDRP